jgi:hypothetical protein
MFPHDTADPGRNSVIDQRELKIAPLVEVAFAQAACAGSPKPGTVIQQPCS